MPPVRISAATIKVPRITRGLLKEKEILAVMFFNDELKYFLNRKKDTIKATIKDAHVPLEKVRIMLEKITALEIIHNILCQIGFSLNEKCRLRRNGIIKNPP